jgi:uncharacterized repeat protein (TIGR01451 family)/CSLREA domain-containing protein
MGRGLLAIALSLVLMSTYMPVPAAAAIGDIVVTSNVDVADSNPGDGTCSAPVYGCTLRAAIQTANANADVNKIILAAGTTYTLAIGGTGEDSAASGDLDILHDVTIVGSGGSPDGDRNSTIIQAGSIAKGGVDRVFHVNPLGAGAVNATFQALTIRNGNVPGISDVGSGGGIEFETNGNTSSLTLYNVVVDNNKTAGATGAAGGPGGGLDLYNYTTTPATVLIEKSVISNNETTTANGGGICAENINLTIRDSTISGNNAVWSTGASLGGGLAIFGTTTVVTVERSLFANNQVNSTGNGGAIYTTSAAISVVNSTFSGNYAGSDGGAISFGGAGKTLSLINATITGNTANTGNGGGLNLISGTTTMHNTIVYGNTATVSDNIQGSVVGTPSNNMVGSDGTGGLTNGTNGNKVGVNPLLSALADNGGPTRTHALQKGSPALDAGNIAYVTTTDQRGRPRLADVIGESPEDTADEIDIGAYELSPTIATITAQSGTVGQALSVPVFAAGKSTIGTTPVTIAVSASSANAGVVPNDAGHLSVTNPTSITPTLQITGAAPGTSDITVTVTGSAGGTDSTTFTVTLTGAPDLIVTKTHSGNFRQGGTGTYSITVTNQGQVATNGSAVTVTDTLPTGLTAFTMSGTGWSCSTGTVSCTRSGALAAGGSWDPISLTVSVTGNPGNVTNSVSVAGGGDGDISNNGDTDLTTVDPSSDLELLVTGPASVVKGGSGTNTISVTNNGPSATSGTITVNDTLSAGLTLTGASGTGWTCNAVSPVVCTRTAALGAGQSTSIALTFTVDGSASAQVTNSATVTHANDLNAANNSASRTMDVFSYPDLTVTKTHAGNFRQGGTGTYTITVTNSGYAATDGSTVTLTDAVPAGMTAAAMDGGADWSCAQATLTCTSTKVVAAGASFGPVTLTVDVDASAGSPLTNSVSVSGGGEQNTANNTASDLTTVDQASDLTITMTDGGATFTQGQSGTYTLTVTNSGLLGPTVGTVTVTGDGGTGFTVTGMSGTGWTCTGSTCTRSDALPAGASYPAITVTVSVGASTGRTITNTASVSGGGEVNTANNTAGDTTAVKQLPDLQVAVAPATTFEQGQTGARYTLTVSNTGTGLTTGTVSVAVDSLNASLTPTGFSGGPNWSCNPVTLTCTRSDDLDGGAAYEPITLTVDVAADAPSSVTTAVSVAGGDDQNATNNTGSDTTAITQKPDVTVNLSHSGNFREAQTGATYTIAVHNAGGIPTAGTVTLVDTLPGGLTATAMIGTGWACNLSTLTCTYSDPVPGGADFPAITLTVDVDSNTSANLTNTVSVSGGGELKVANNTDSDPTAIDQVADLTIALSDGGATFTQGQSGTYTLTVTNSGEGPTVGTVTVTDSDGSGFSVTGMSGTGWTCDTADGTSTCSRSDALAGGASYPDITVTVSVGQYTGRTLTNTATVTGGGELNTADDTATDTTSVTQLPDLAINVAPAGTFTQGQTGAGYTVTVINTGTGLTTGTVSVAVDILDGSLTPTGLSGTNWSCDPATLACTRSDELGGGASYEPITLTVDVAATAPTSVTTAATVAGGDDQNSANNTGSHTTTIIQKPDLTVNLSHSGNFREGGSSGYTIVAHNAGGTATGGTVTVVDTLPTGLTATAMTGTGWACNPGTLTCTYSDPVAAGADFPAIALSVNVVGDTPASLTNTVSISGGGELKTDNNTATDPTTIDQVADLSVSVTDGDAAFTQGQTGTYTVIVTNSGPSPTQGAVTVTEAPGADLTVTGMSGTGWTCNNAAGTCTRNDVLNAGASYPAITVTVKVADNANPSATNSITVSSTADITPGNDSATDSTAIVLTPDLRITKTHTDPWRQGELGKVHTITVSNDLPAGGLNTGPTNGSAVTVSDSTAFTPVAMSGTGWTCTLGTLTCTRSDVLNPGSSYPPIVVTVDVPTNSSGATTSFTVSGGGELASRTGNNLGNETTTVVKMPNLTASVAPNGRFQQGQHAYYDIDVQNSGFAATDGSPVTFTVTLPPSLTYVGFNPNVPTDWACSNSGQTVTCATTDPGEPVGYWLMILEAAVAGDAPSTVTTSVTVAGGGQIWTADDADSDVTTVLKAPDLSITKTHTGNFTQGQTGATYTLTVTNDSGAGPTVGTVTVSDTPPAGLTLVGMSGDGWTCDNAAGTCTRSDELAAGASYPAITATVDVAATAPRTVSNTAGVAGGGDLTSANNTATDATGVKQLPDLEVGIAPNGTFTQGQTDAAYILTVTNTGTGLTTGTVSVAIDSLSSYLAPTGISGGANWNCNPTTLICTRSDDLAGGDTYDLITLTVGVAADAPTSVTTAVSVAGGDDQDATNNTGSHTTTIIRKPDLTVTKTHAGNFREGQASASYTITVHNAGGLPTAGTVTLTDTLPAGLSASAMGGTGWFCDKATLICTYSDPVAAGVDFPAITLTVAVAENTPATLTNNVSVSGGGELKTDNNSAADPTTIDQAADLTIAKSHAGTFRQGQHDAVFTLVVSNVGDGPTAGTVTVTEAPDAGLTATYLAGDGWTCDSGSLTCSRSDVLAPGAGSSYPAITLKVDVDTFAPTSLTNRAQVSGGDQVIFGNDQASDTAAIQAVADLTLTKSHRGNFVPGRTGVYTLEVRNAGQGAADAPVTVTDTLPAGMTAVTMIGDGWTCDVATLSCSRSDSVAPGGGYPLIALKVSVAPNLLGTFTNTAGVSGGGEANFANNSASDPTRVSRPEVPPPPFVTISVSTELTNQSSITVHGTATPGATISVNGTGVSVGQGATWSATVALQEGPNLITAVNGTASDSVTVTRDTVPPPLTLTASAIQTDQETVELTAASEAGARITIDGRPGASQRVHLELGANTFTAAATDPAGNTATATVTVERVAPTTPPVEPPHPTEPPPPPGPPAEPPVQLPVPPPAQQPPAPFKDVEHHWAVGAVARMVELGVIRGYEDDTFRPEAAVSRLEFAVMVTRLLKLAPADQQPTFTDGSSVPDWARDQVAAAVQAGIITGRPDGTFDPTAPVTRAEVAVMLVRALRYRGLDVTPGSATFTDAIPDWARAFVLAAARYGLVNGYDDGSFQADASATRAEAATMLSRLLDTLSR